MNLTDLRKENEVLDIFCELVQIPSPSLKEEKVAEWIMGFCSKNDINLRKDEYGNIYILNRFTNKDIGIPAYNNWRDSESFYLENIYVQDNYRVLNTDEKITDIIKAFEVQQKENTLVINFMSCYLEKDIFPLMYALKPSIVINDWLRENINKFDSTGILLADFMTEDLAESIYMRNFK